MGIKCLGTLPEITKTETHIRPLLPQPTFLPLSLSLFQYKGKSTRPFLRIFLIRQNENVETCRLREKHKMKSFALSDATPSRVYGALTDLISHIFINVRSRRKTNKKMNWSFQVHMCTKTQTRTQHLHHPFIGCTQCNHSEDDNGEKFHDLSL